MHPCIIMYFILTSVTIITLQTKRKLCKRISEHKLAVRHANFNESALAEHAWTENHPVNWSNVEILSAPHDDYNRIVQEAFSIRSTPNTLNRDGGSLPDEYDF